MQQYIILIIDLQNLPDDIALFCHQVVPYWGNTQDRKVLRKFWNPELIHTEDASFHVVVTSYQLIIQDVKYFQRIRWHYMILDEAQAIKSTSRWVDTGQGRVLVARARTKERT